MALVITKSPSIISWDSFPIVDVTTGEGAPGFMKVANDGLTAPLLGTIGDMYRFCRIPTNAKIKKVLITVTTAATAGAMDIDIAYSDSTVDGTQQSLATLVNPVVQVSGPVDNKMFSGGTPQALTAAIKNTDVTFAGTFLPVHQNLPLWQVLVNLLATQFTSDPGGWFDIIGKVTTVPTVTSPVMGIEVDYVE